MKVSEAASSVQRWSLDVYHLRYVAELLSDQCGKMGLPYPQRAIDDSFGRAAGGDNSPHVGHEVFGPLSPRAYECVGFFSWIWSKVSFCQSVHLDAPHSTNV